MDGTVSIRGWRPGDLALLLRAEPEISPASLRARFFGGFPRLPGGYLRLVESSAGGSWSGVVALAGESAGAGVPGDRLVGWAEVVRYADPASADLALLVVDAWQHQGVGRALIQALLPYCRSAGVRVLHADVELGNTAARALFTSFRRELGDMLATGPLTATVEDGMLHYAFAVDALDARPPDQPTPAGDLLAVAGLAS